MKKMLTGMSLLALFGASCGSTPAIQVIPEGNSTYILEGESLHDTFEWLLAHAVPGNTYYVMVGADEIITPQVVIGDITVILESDTGEERIIELSGSGTMFYVGISTEGLRFRGGTLVLGPGITLLGRDPNTAPLVIVENEGRLVMQDGSRIVGNNNTASGAEGDGGAVRVNYGGTFFMTGGEIFGNSARNGGAVFSGDIMPGLFVTQSNARTPDIWLLAAENSPQGGAIFGNTARQDGGGIWAGRRFVLEAGEILNNTAGRNGGGIFVYGDQIVPAGHHIPIVTLFTPRYIPNFEMAGGVVDGNTAQGSGQFQGGGGIFLDTGRSYISGGEISNNTTAGSGGGIAVIGRVRTPGVYIRGHVRRNGGIIYGSNAPGGFANIARDGAAWSDLGSDNTWHHVSHTLDANSR